VILEVRDVSFSLPQRKKQHMGIAQYGADINAPSTKFAIYTRNPATNEVDMEVPLDRFAYALRLPVPEKTSKLYNFCLLPKSTGPQSTEPIIWTVNHGPLKSCHISNPVLAKIASGPEDVLETALDYILKKHGINLTFPTAAEFASATPEAHRKGEKAYHVKAFRGSKDGFLFFLEHGIFFGFKKPLAFFAFEDIVSVSYTSVLQRTFNLNITYRPSDSSADNSGGDLEDMDVVQEVEFSMVDQADYPGIDAYIKRHGLQDASLAESRRGAKSSAGANGKASARSAGRGDDNDEVDENDPRSELEKAQQELEDQEDEEEEDYDPGSEGESEGSGEDSEDDDEEEIVRERKSTRAKDLVAEELGSEAEDVSVTEDEGGDEGDEGEGGEEGAQEEEDGDEGEEEEEYDEEDGDLNHATSGAVPSTSHPAWDPEDGMPDPNDEDQL
jgi:hypothetical protein